MASNEAHERNKSTAKGRRKNITTALLTLLLFAVAGIVVALFLTIPGDVNLKSGATPVNHTTAVI